MLGLVLASLAAPIGLAIATYYNDYSGHSIGIPPQHYMGGEPHQINDNAADHANIYRHYDRGHGHHMKGECDCTRERSRANEECYREEIVVKGIIEMVMDKGYIVVETENNSYTINVRGIWSSDGITVNYTEILSSINVGDQVVVKGWICCKQEDYVRAYQIVLGDNVYELVKHSRHIN